MHPTTNKHWNHELRKCNGIYFYIKSFEQERITFRVFYWEFEIMIKRNANRIICWIGWTRARESEKKSRKSRISAPKCIYIFELWQSLSHYLCIRCIIYSGTSVYPKIYVHINSHGHMVNQHSCSKYFTNFRKKKKKLMLMWWRLFGSSFKTHIFSAIAQPKKPETQKFRIRVERRRERIIRQHIFYMMYTVTINGLINFMCKWKYSLLNIVNNMCEWTKCA